MPYDLSSYTAEQQAAINLLAARIYGQPANSMVSDYPFGAPATAELFNKRQREVEALIAYLHDMLADEKARAIAAEQAAGGGVFTVRTVTSTTTLLSTDGIVLVNAPGAVTITLPPVSTWVLGRELVIKDVSGAASTRNITCVAGTGATVGEPAVINADYSSLVFFLHGTTWRVK